jgi:hypothetical protein
MYRFGDLVDNNTPSAGHTSPESKEKKTRKEKQSNTTHTASKYADDRKYTSSHTLFITLNALNIHR